MYLELNACQDISRLWALYYWLRPGSGRRLRGRGTGVCGYPAPSLCRRGLTFSARRRPGSAPGISIQIDAGAVAGVDVSRQRWRVEDGVREQHELDRHCPWRAASRIPALGETVLLADRALERLHQLRVQFPSLIRRHVEHARGAAPGVLRALRPRCRRGE